jgi:hypothetical protein
LTRILCQSLSHSLKLVLISLKETWIQEEENPVMWLSHKQINRYYSVMVSISRPVCVMCDVCVCVCVCVCLCECVCVCVCVCDHLFTCLSCVYLILTMHCLSVCLISLSSLLLLHLPITTTCIICVKLCTLCLLNYNASCLQRSGWTTAFYWSYWLPGQQMVNILFMHQRWTLLCIL